MRLGKLTTQFVKSDGVDGFLGYGGEGGTLSPLHLHILP